MAQKDQLQAQRFELKYLVSESLTSKIRSFIKTYLDPDEFGMDSPERGYPVHSIYLDSEDMQTYHWTLNGNEDRFKLRVRYYEEGSNSAVFFETKRRINDCVLKERCGVRSKAAHLVVNGQIPATAELVSSEPRHVIHLQRFCSLMTKLRAKPKSHVAYAREAWVSRNDNSVRLTMDRNVCCEPQFELRLQTEMHRPFYIFGSDVVLEIKFTERYPRWCKEFVETFGLMQCGGAKYATGVEQLGEGCFADARRTLAPVWLKPAPDLCPAAAKSLAA